MYLLCVGIVCTPLLLLGYCIFSVSSHFSRVEDELEGHLRREGRAPVSQKGRG